MIGATVECIRFLLVFRFRLNAFDGEGTEETFAFGKFLDKSLLLGQNRSPPILADAELAYPEASLRLR